MPEGIGQLTKKSATGRPFLIRDLRNSSGGAFRTNP